MEVDHVTYIFGSFSRRRQADDVTASKRKSLDPSPIVTQQCRTGRMPVENRDDQQFLCPLCQRQFTDPKVLPCLHTFCTACLHKLESNRGLSSWDGECATRSEGELEFVRLAHNGTGAEVNGSSTGSGSGCSGGSGYESEGHSDSGSWAFRNKAYSLLACPTCGTKNKLPPGGVAVLPPHYMLQHRMVLASLNQESTCLLCDLCSTDIPATSRCTDCLLSLCTFCCEAHQRQRVTAGHEVLALHEARQRGITRVRRQAMCPAHPELELQLFCTSCGQVACRECCLLIHHGHACDTAAQAVQMYTHSMKDALESARPIAEEVVVSLGRLQHLSKRIQMRCSQVHEEVDQFIDSYISALEEHRRTLQVQVQEAHEAKLHMIHAQQLELERHAKDSQNAVSFAEDLLAESSDIELLSLVVPVLHRLEWCCTAIGSSLMEPRVSECLRFLPNETAEKIKGHALFGIITTQVISHQHCTLNVNSLMDVCQHQKAESVMVTRDADDQPLCHGGEKVVAEVWHRDASCRKIPVQVTDQQDGTYLISFVPDTSGNLSLSVSVQGKPIQGSPFHMCVRSMHPHQGTFHCCSFCSSGGNKEATCGCGGKMPGGYRGCGHGHTGHPGRRHWSCCGNILQNSECGRPNSSVYQFTL
ncbi:tripartite motif-containing protein 45 isoform X2 [Zootermopsis nevadensis]|uniref:tripartite motif-containing protein 45 isoform X2 n=1 Tax=Zootermopsis nevadensis TaxID=136037 RepID=UPI000B8EAC10|nr:tripartite motif-containing protein 45 isoform X2 [Zootermopsis nevadensis]